MKLLLDTHAFLWFVAGDTKLCLKGRTLIQEDANEKFVSIASLWEIAIKTNLGKLSLDQPFDVLIPREIATNGFKVLPVDIAHTTLVSQLPLHHRDPFDRMLVAQALSEHLPVLSNDTALDAYGITRLW